MVAAFHDVLFPLRISFGASGGPERANEIIRLHSGRERRNQRHRFSRRRYDVGTGVRSVDELEQVVAFFEARRGTLAAFRFRDPLDHKSCVLASVPMPGDQHIGAGDGTTLQFPLTKTYGGAPDGYVRPITKPVEGTVRIAVAGVEAGANDIAIDHASGIVTFTPQAVPPPGADVTAGFEFDVPVRFDAEQLAVSLASFRAGQVPSIPLVEVVP